MTSPKRDIARTLKLIFSSLTLEDVGLDQMGGLSHVPGYVCAQGPAQTALLPSSLEHSLWVSNLSNRPEFLQVLIPAISFLIHFDLALLPRRLWLLWPYCRPHGSLVAREDRGIFPPKFDDPADDDRNGIANLFRLPSHGRNIGCAHGCDTDLPLASHRVATVDGQRAVSN